MKIKSITLNQKPKELSLRETIQLVVANSTDENYKKLLQGNLYSMFVERIYKYCVHIANKKFKNSHDWRTLSEDIVQDTFQFALFNLSKFKVDKKWSETELEYKLVGWLNSIAEHKLYDEYNRDRGDNEGLEVIALNYDLKKKLRYSKTANLEDIFVVEREVLAQAMKKISERNADVFLTYLREGSLYGEKHMKDHILKALCEKWGITKGNARLIKMNTFEELKRLCLEEKTKAA